MHAPLCGAVSLLSFTKYLLMLSTCVQIIRDFFNPYHTMGGPDSYPQYCYRGVTYDAPLYTEYELTTLEYEQDIEDNGY